jgi:long-chain acyl-CoA synthetase
MNIANHIDRGAREHPDRPALVFEGRQITYGECARRAAQAAEVFLAAGIAAGDRIALFLPNVPDFAVVYLGALKIGAIAVAINSGFKLEMKLHLADCGVRPRSPAPSCANTFRLEP